MSTVNATLAKLQEDILGIIGSAYVILKDDSATEVLYPSVEYKPCAGNRMTLLEIACLGNPEKTLQGEILHGLRCLGWTVVQEAGYINPKRSPDFLVFDKDKKSDAQNNPLCVIEMKHRSPHEGKIEVFLNDIEADYTRRVAGIPIMHLALYTTVRTITDRPLATTGFYRFLKRYCTKDYTKGNVFYGKMTAWSNLKKWAINPAISKLSPDEEKYHFMDDGTNHEVTGHVEFFVGIRL